MPSVDRFDGSDGGRKWFTYRRAAAAGAAPAHASSSDSDRDSRMVVVCLSDWFKSGVDRSGAAAAAVGGRSAVCQSAQPPVACPNATTTSEQGCRRLCLLSVDRWFVDRRQQSPRFPVVVGMRGMVEPISRCWDQNLSCACGVGAVRKRVWSEQAKDGAVPTAFVPPEVSSAIRACSTFTGGRVGLGVCVCGQHG